MQTRTPYGPKLRSPVFWTLAALALGGAVAWAAVAMAQTAYEPPCRTTANTVTSVTTTAGYVPGTALAGRHFVVVCNSPNNTAGRVKCRADGTAAAGAANNTDAGDVLTLGDCARYDNSASSTSGDDKRVSCISDMAGGVAVTAWECKR